MESRKELITLSSVPWELFIRFVSSLLELRIIWTADFTYCFLPNQVQIILSTFQPFPLMFLPRNVQNNRFSWKAIKARPHPEVKHSKYESTQKLSSWGVSIGKGNKLFTFRWISFHRLFVYIMTLRAFTDNVNNILINFSDGMTRVEGRGFPRNESTSFGATRLQRSEKKQNDQQKIGFSCCFLWLQSVRRKKFEMENFPFFKKEKISFNFPFEWV